MHWQSLSDFLHMGGYGLYVWGSFGVSAAVLLLEPLLLRRRHAAAVAALKRRVRARRLGEGTTP